MSCGFFCVCCSFQISVNKQLNKLRTCWFLGSITLALQTAARLSQHAELGGIIEEIEVSIYISTRWRYAPGLKSNTQ